VGAISLGWTPDGKRIRRKATGRTKTEVRDKLKRLQAEADAGLKTSASYTLSKAVDDWAAEALDGLAAKTVQSHVDLLRPVTMLIGNIPLRDLSAQDVRRALNKLAEQRSTRTMASTHNVLVRAIRHAEANDHVGRNVASFVKPPQGKTGRPSRAMTPVETAALLAAATDDHPARRLRNPVPDHWHQDRGSPGAAVGSRRLGWRPGRTAPAPAVRRGLAFGSGSRRHQDGEVPADPRPAAERGGGVEGAAAVAGGAQLAAGPPWHDDALVFTTSVGTPLDASHVRRDFRALCKKAGVVGVWAPRELRHTFVSVMSNSGVAVEEIAT
jgi:site-specific recombinase XerD